MSNVRLSVVIPVYNNWWLTARCLRSLEQLRDSCSFAFETILVDNASSDETPQAVARFGWVRYVRHDENRNFAGACNAGTRFAQAPVTLLLNNDAYPLGDALTPLVAAFEREEVAIAGGALFFEDGVTQAAGLVVLRNAHWHYSCRNLPPSLEAVTTSRDALGVSGAAMAVRTDWFVRQWIRRRRPLLTGSRRRPGDCVRSGRALRALRGCLGRTIRTRSRKRAEVLRPLAGSVGIVAAYGTRRGRRD
jgi:GT2 family glycosyltransferase